MGEVYRARDEKLGRDVALKVVHKEATHTVVYRIPIDGGKGEEETVRLVATSEAVFLPFVVVAELRAAFALGKRAAENERLNACCGGSC